MIKSDFHSHTVLCDGQNTAAQMAAAAYDKGLSAFGFSGHGYTPFDSSYCMSEQDTEQYLSQIRKLKTEYAGKMQIFAGLEADLFSEYDRNKFDYIIGSVHYIKTDAGYFDADNTPLILRETADKYFGGDMLSLCERYYEQVSLLKDVDIIGHFDVITKFCEQHCLFDPDCSRYRAAAFAALDVLISRDPVFEVNTGAMARGTKSQPYPSRFILKRIFERGGRVIFSSDAHSTQTILSHFDSARLLLKSVGFKSRVTLTETGFQEIEI